MMRRLPSPFTPRATRRALLLATLALTQLVRLAQCSSPRFPETRGAAKCLVNFRNLLSTGSAYWQAALQRVRSFATAYSAHGLGLNAAIQLAGLLRLPRETSAWWLGLAAVDLEGHLVGLGQEPFGDAQQCELVFCRACLGKPGLDYVDAQGDRAYAAEVADLRQPVL